MGHEYVSPLRKWDVIAGLAQTIQAKSVACVDEKIIDGLKESLPDLPINALSHDLIVTSDPEEIGTAWEHLRQGGYLCVTDYNHKHVELMRAVEGRFPLLEVAIFPDGVAAIEKRA